MFCGLKFKEKKICHHISNGNYITPDGSSLLNFDTPIGTYQTYYETQV